MREISIMSTGRRITFPHFSKLLPSKIHCEDFRKKNSSQFPSVLSLFTSFPPFIWTTKYKIKWNLILFEVGIFKIAKMQRTRSLRAHELRPQTVFISRNLLSFISKYLENIFIVHPNILNPSHSWRFKTLSFSTIFLSLVLSDKEGSQQ